MTRGRKSNVVSAPEIIRHPATPIRFVDADTVSDDLAIDRRTLGRRVRGRIRGDQVTA